MKRKILTYALTAPLLPLSSHGEAVLQDSYAPQVAGGAPTQLDGGTGPFGYEIELTTEDFSAAGHGKLVMVYSGKDENGGDLAGAPVARVTYGGAELTEAFFSADELVDRVSIGIYYLDNVARDGNLRIELADEFQSEYGFGLYALDGLQAGVQDVSSGSGALIEEATVTVTTDSGFVVQEAARNNQSLADDPDDDFETLYNHEGPQSYRALSQYQITTAPGDYFAPINNGGVRFRLVAAAAFEAGAGTFSGAPQITTITPVETNLWELTLSGTAEASYEFYSSSTLDFTPGTLVENLAKGDPADPGTVGGTNNSVLTLNAEGEGKVQVVLSGDPADFLRAQAAQ